MSQLQRAAGTGGDSDQDEALAGDVSELKSIAERAKDALARADADLEAKKEAIRQALKGPVRESKKEESVGQSRSRSWFDRTEDFCSC